MAAGLSSCDRDELVTSHAAFHYLAERYGLEQVAITGVSPEAEPDPERLADLTDLIDRHGVTTVFHETLVSADLAETLAREAGVETAVLDPIEGLSRRRDRRRRDLRHRHGGQPRRPAGGARMSLNGGDVIIEAADVGYAYRYAPRARRGQLRHPSR